MRKISYSKINELFACLDNSYSVYLPSVASDGQSHYTKWKDGITYSTALNTVRSAKDFFFPQTENLVDFKMDGKNIEIIDTREPNEDFVIFGVRACDVKSFEILDRVFLSQPCDSYYASRRQHGIIMSMACTKPAETCFCNTFGIDPSEPCGDVSCWIENNELYMQANTEKGKALLDKVENITENCNANPVEEQKKLIKQRVNALPLADLTTDGFGNGLTKELFESEEWKTLSQSCLGCGTCTFVCPTCQCYDIKDFKTNKGVRRFRCWDSCMYSDFTKMSAGQPRLTQLERFRQRFMHKLVYYPENNNGLFSCVGCGRCLSKCPVSMNIVKVMKSLGGKNNE